MLHKQRAKVVDRVLTTCSFSKEGFSYFEIMKRGKKRFWNMHFLRLDRAYWYM